MTSPSPMPLWMALAPVVLLVALLGADVVYFGEDSSYGSNQIALLLAALFAGVLGMTRGTKWSEMKDAIAQSIGTSTEAILILLLIGALSGTWLLAGIIPAFIHYGMMILQPSIFLFAACIVCAVLSLATGSSWGTVGTVGIALVGIGQALGLSEGWVAGAIISGAYFGDKMSPLSDTTNLAPAVAGTDLITHIRYMTYTTGPSIVVALIVFLVVGFGGGAVSGECRNRTGFRRSRGRGVLHPSRLVCGAHCGARDDCPQGARCPCPVHRRPSWSPHCSGLPTRSHSASGWRGAVLCSCIVRRVNASHGLGCGHHDGSRVGG